MTDETARELKVNLKNLKNITPESLRILEERLAVAKGIVIGIIDQTNETSGYVYTNHAGMTDFIINLIDEFPDVAEAVACYLISKTEPIEGETNESPDVEAEEVKAAEIESKPAPTFYIC